MRHSYSIPFMLKAFSPDNPDDGVWNCLGETPYEPFLIAKIALQF